MKQTIAGQRRRRRGVTLMEVLISTFVLSIGLLGLAALIPVGNVGILAATKADRAGACARAGLSNTKIYRLLDSNNWTGTPSSGSFAIDPLGGASSIGFLDKVSLKNPATGMAWTDDMIEHVFRWHDDLAFAVPKDVSLRPVDAGYGEKGLYSWFLTATPSPIDTEVFQVSIVVCHGRDFSQGSENTNAKVQGGGWGGGRVELGGAIKVNEDDWILLCDAAGNAAKWYRVVGVAAADGTDGGEKDEVELNGPDCPEWAGSNVKAAVIHDVVGVCTATIELDRFSIWNQ